APRASGITSTSAKAKRNVIAFVARAPAFAPSAAGSAARNASSVGERTAKNSSYRTSRAARASRSGAVPADALRSSQAPPVACAARGAAAAQRGSGERGREGRAVVSRGAARPPEREREQSETEEGTLCA